MKVRHFRRQHLQHCPQALAIARKNRERKLQRRNIKQLFGVNGLMPWNHWGDGHSRRQMFAGHDSSSRLQMFAKQMQRDPIVVELQPAAGDHQYSRENQLTYTRYSMTDEDGILLNPAVAELDFKTFQTKVFELGNGRFPLDLYGSKAAGSVQ